MNFTLESEEWCLLSDIIDDLDEKLDNILYTNYKFNNIVKLLDAI